MLKQFRALPTERRVRDMLDRDYVWCLAQQLLDDEEELDRLCPACRAKALEERCSACGQPAASWGGVNPAFDQERFDKLKEGEGLD